MHYGEIGLKKANTDYFVGKLQGFLKGKLEKSFGGEFVINHTLRRLLVALPKNFKENRYVQVVSRIFGIKNFKFVYEGAIDLEKLGNQIWKNLPKFEQKPANFVVRVKRSMLLPYKSFEAERDLGAVLLEKGLNLPVKLKGAELEIDVEFFNDCGYFSFQKHQGAGGLSPNSQSKLVALISAGIDSPVASYLMMRRGARVIFTHFHGYPYTDKEEAAQVRQLVKILSQYQLATKLYLVPFGQVQKAIATSLDVPGKVRTILYRRIMLRIAERIAKKEEAKGLITGDNFGQVASQTPENIFAIHDASTIPLLQPLIGFDKEEIVRLAEKIGTYEISKLPCKDTCMMFMPRKPELKAKVYEIRKYEEGLAIEEWVEKVMTEAEIISF